MERQRGGCVLNGCLTLLVVALALVGYGWWRLETAPGRTQARARDDVTRAAAETRTRLSAAAAGDTLFETELDRVFRTGPDRWAEKRDGRHVTVTALLTGRTGVWMGTVTADGCYEFTVTPAAAPPPVGEREVPDGRCERLPPRPVREPADVARDLAAELRATASEGTAGDSARWTILTSTPGVRLQDRVYEGSGAAQSTVGLVRLDGGSGPQGWDCYEFRVRPPHTAAFKPLKPDGCHRIQRQREAQARAARRDRLDEAAGRIRRALGDAVAGDGRLTDAETRRVFALRQEDAVTPRQVLANLTHTDRSADGARITLTARVNGLRSTPWYEGCYAFRVDLRAGSVTARTTAKACPVPGS
ncbi:hypothetical protein ACFC4G_01615 [Streptomyces sp. NPDC056002]|uniref:hypothetical protein n=1 Tax=Streptomyces sp. NPDC056002 TaxID=3345675 RepID=UPI0035DCEC26